MKLDHIALERLSISPANMRARKKADIDNILPSVRARGILVPLLVRPNGGPDHYEIVAGRRRYLCAQTIAGESGDYPPLPCAILEAGEDAAALEVSLIENVARLDADEVTQWETFSRLIREGKTAEDIAATFGITETLVRRILALGNLAPRIRSLYRQEKIDAATVRHLTMASKTQQQDWLKLYDSETDYAPTGSRLKEWLFGGDLIATKAALFDLTAYPGEIVSDLFGEDSYFADPDLFWRLQLDAVAARREALLEAGWASVELLERGNGFARWDHEKRTKAKGGRVYITLSRRGEVEVHEGWIPIKEARRLDRGEADTPRTTASRPEYTSALRNYLDLHRHAAVRATLLERPDLAFPLMLAHAILGSALWQVRPDPQHALKAEIAESVETSTAETRFDAQRRVVLGLLGFDAEALNVVRGGDYRLTKTMLLERLLALSDAELRDVATLVIGETLESGSGMVDDLGNFLTLDMATLWQADDVFFELVRDKQLLSAMIAELAGPDAASANEGATGKVLKGVIRDCLAGENGRTKVENWVPKWLQFPARSYRPADERTTEQATAETPEPLSAEAEADKPPEVPIAEAAE